jgi:hypothetical protein
MVVTGIVRCCAIRCTPRILRILAMSKAFAALPDTGFERFGNFRDNLTSGEVIPERADYFQICKPSVAIGA